LIMCRFKDPDAAGYELEAIAAALRANGLAEAAFFVELAALSLYEPDTLGRGRLRDGADINDAIERPKRVVTKSKQRITRRSRKPKPTRPAQRE
jgi:hypothetical protein